MLHYWLAQERSHYPYARENVEYFEQLVRQMQAQAQRMAVAPVGAVPAPQTQNNVVEAVK